MVDGDCDCRRAPGSDDWACDCDEGFGLCIPVGREDCHTFEAPEPCRFLPGCTEDWNGGQDCWCDPCDCDDARCDCDWPEEDCGGCDQPCGCGEGIAPRPLCVADLTRCGSILDPDACEAVAGCQPRWEQPVPDCDAEHDCPAVLLFTRCDPTD